MYLILLTTPDLEVIILVGLSLNVNLSLLPKNLNNYNMPSLSTITDSYFGM